MTSLLVNPKGKPWKTWSSFPVRDHKKWEPTPLCNLSSIIGTGIHYSPGRSCTYKKISVFLIKITTSWHLNLSSLDPTPSPRNWSLTCMTSSFKRIFQIKGITISFVFAAPFKNRGKLHTSLWAAAGTALTASAHNLLKLHKDHICKVLQFC